MLKKTWLLTLGCLLSSFVFANIKIANMEQEVDFDSFKPLHRWSLVTSLGYGDYQKVFHAEGRTPLARMAVATELLTTNQATIGLEAGVQNGNRMQLNFTQDIKQNVIATILNGLTVASTVKPMLDLLFTANSDLIGATLFFAQLKAGLAYRQWQIDSANINNKSELGAEVQAGLGCPITEITSLNLLYQGVFGANPKLRFNNITNKNVISNIPVQHGILLGFSITT